MQRVTLTAFMVCAAWLSFGQTARFGDLNRNSVVVTSAPPQSVVSVNGQTGAVVITADQIGTNHKTASGRGCVRCPQRKNKQQQQKPQ